MINQLRPTVYVALHFLIKQEAMIKHNLTLCCLLALSLLKKMSDMRFSCVCNYGTAIASELKLLTNIKHYKTLPITQMSV